MKNIFIIIICLLCISNLYAQEESEMDRKQQKEEKKVERARRRLERKIIYNQLNQERLYIGGNRAKQAQTLYIGVSKIDSIKIMDLTYKKYNTIANLSLGLSAVGFVVYFIADEIANSDRSNLVLSVLEGQFSENKVIKGLGLGIGSASLINGIFYKIKARYRLRDRLVLSTNGRGVGVDIKF